MVVSGHFVANENTPYTVNYYYQNAENGSYSDEADVTT
jgi:hypothetical protein